MTRIHFGENYERAQQYRMIDGETGEEMRPKRMRWADDETGEYFCFDEDEHGKLIMDGDGCGVEPCVGTLYSGKFRLVPKT